MDIRQKSILSRAWIDISNTEKKLINRLLDISFKNKLSHLGSCLSALPIIYKIYNRKEEEDIFLLSCGHAGLALYVVLEHFYGFDAEELFHQHGVHPNRDIEHKIFCSTGSLGLGLPIAVGAALANKEREVICLISDGECAEGSIWESLRFIHESNLQNITVVVNANGYSALSEVNLEYLRNRLFSFLPEVVFCKTPSCFNGIPNGLESHYHIMSEEDYEKAISQFII